MRRRTLLGAGAAGLGLFALPSWARRPRPRPNILFIMADDLGWGDLGCYGRDDVATPAIDGLGRTGMRFTQAYANSAVCSPTRVALITGRYQNRLLVGQEEPLNGDVIGLEPGVATLPRLLKRLGYQTSLVGKWHLGRALKFSPLRHGYDRFWGIRGGGVDYFTHRLRIELPGGTVDQADLWDGDVPVSKQGYLTDLLGDRAVDEVRRMSQRGAPFLLSLHFTAPHWPWETETDAAAAEKVRNIFHYDGGSIETFRRMVAALDRNVGKVLDAIEASGRAGDTIVVFTSDNGGERFSRNWPFSGMKGELLEGGIRTPLLVRWPDRVPAGAVSEQIAISMDWLPTLLDAAGVPPGRFDGESLLPALGDASIESDRILFWRYRAHAQKAARRDRWKYLSIDGREYLFDVVADPQERANRKDAEPAIFGALQSAWAEWNAQMLPYRDSNSHDNREAGALADRY
jgi:arylsulfatase A-like enzyme